MNSLAQIHAKRIKRLEQQNAFLLGVIERALNEIDALESLGCAFAWDAVGCSEPDSVWWLEKMWSDAIKEALNDSV